MACKSRLVLLAVQADIAGEPTLREGIDAAIDELRSLVDGLMPAELTERGLPAAVQELAHRMPAPVTLKVDASRQRLPPAVESTGFFVVSEALVNASSPPRPVSWWCRCAAMTATGCGSRSETTASAARVEATASGP
jgi:hypothetical protein